VMSNGRLCTMGLAEPNEKSDRRIQSSARHVKRQSAPLLASSSQFDAVPLKTTNDNSKKLGIVEQRF
jgi:hypothetical protein